MPPRALEVFGTGHRIEQNVIGVDEIDNEVGVCGQGTKVAGSNIQVLDNTIVGSQTDAADADGTAILTFHGPWPLDDPAHPNGFFRTGVVGP